MRIGLESLVHAVEFRRLQGSQWCTVRGVSGRANAHATPIDLVRDATHTASIFVKPARLVV